jgi:hypothetical protein
MIAYVFSSTKLEKRAKQVLPRNKWVRGRKREWGTGGRDGPDNVRIYEKMNK